MIVKYKLNGQYCNPVKRENIFLEINHDQGAIINQSYPNVGVKNLYFAREDILAIMNYVSNPPGITEGIPFDIEITEAGTTEIINFYIDLMDGFQRSNDGIQASIKLLQSLDWLDDRVQAFTFESMYNETSVTPFQIDGITYSSYQDYFDKRCIYIPYVISTIPNFNEAFMGLFSLTYIIIQLEQGIKTLIQWCTPIAGVLPSIGIAQIVLEVVFMILMLAALLALIENIFNCLLQPIKYHGAMLIIDLLKIVAQKVGLTFQSSIWQSAPFNQLAYLPEKYNPIEDSNPATNSIFGQVFNGFAKRGFTSPGYASGSHTSMIPATIQKGYFNGLGGDFLRLVKTYSNGKIIIPDATNTLLLERRDYYPSGTPFQLPNIRQDWNGYNTDELSATIEIRFADDLNDKNCIDKYIGTILQATHQQVIVNDILKVGLKGLKKVQINAARGVRKETLNLIETIHRDLYSAFHIIANAGIIVIDVAIIAADVFIAYINAYIIIFNLMMDAVIAVIVLVNAIVSAISSLFGGHGNTPPSWIPVTSNTIPFITPISLLPVNPKSYTDRIGALLLENDMVTTPKILLVDTNRIEFTQSTKSGNLGQDRIAYLHPYNSQQVHAQKLWDDGYFIDAFVGIKNNRFTKIAPANNHATDKNPVLVRKADFMNMVSNPKFEDNFAEPVIAETIQWYIEKNGASDFQFRKQGWLKDPQNKNGIKRAEEININLSLAITIPNGQ